MVINFPKTFIIIILEINYFKLVLKNVSQWDSNLGPLDYESSMLSAHHFFNWCVIHSLFQLQAKLVMKLYRYNKNII